MRPCLRDVAFFDLMDFYQSSKGQRYSMTLQIFQKYHFRSFFRDSSGIHWWNLLRLLPVVHPRAKMKGWHCTVKKSC